MARSACRTRRVGSRFQQIRQRLESSGLVWRHGSIRIGREKEHTKKLKLETRKQRWNGTVKETEAVSVEIGAPAEHAQGQHTLPLPA